MKNIFLILISAIYAGNLMAQKMNVAVLPVPLVSKKHFAMTNHEHTRIDNYYWLRERNNPEVVDYLNRENTYLDSVMAPLSEYRTSLFEELKGRLKQQDESVPYQNGSYLYYRKYVEEGEYPVYCRKQNNPDAPEEAILDGNKMAQRHKYFNIGGFEVSDNEEILAYSIDTVSRRNYTLKFKNLKTGEEYIDEISNTEGGAYAWATDNKTLFYIVRDLQTLLGSKIYRHVLGTDVRRDELVYEETDHQFYTNIYRSKSKKYIFIISDHNSVSTEYQILEAEKPQDKFKTFAMRRKGLEYYIEHFEDKFYIRTNKDGAINFKLMETPEASHSDINGWKELIPHKPDVLFELMEVFKDYLVLQTRQKGLKYLNVINQKTQKSHTIDFGEPAYDAFIGTNLIFDTPLLRFGYTSLTTPSSTFDYDMTTRSKTLKKEEEVLGGFKKENYQSQRFYVKSRDGVEIPVSIVYHIRTKLDGSAPCLQYAYGSYGNSIDPYFSSTRLSLLDRGFVFVIAHIRGGQEMGRSWYDDGKLLNKKNTFNDFEDVSKYLVDKNLIDKERLFAKGGSAGGLLMGAIANQASELYKAIIAAVPFVDVVTTMLDESIPLTTGEYEEWGNPNNEDYYKYMLSYSPYDNVEEKKYTHILVTTGLHDSQVQYWEPAKWVAKLRELKTDKNVLLLHTNMSAGHGSSSGRFNSLKDLALEFAFILDLAGINH